MELQKSVIFIKKCGFCPQKNQNFNFCQKCPLSIKKHRNENRISFWPTVKRQICLFLTFLLFNAICIGKCNNLLGLILKNSYLVLRCSNLTCGFQFCDCSHVDNCHNQESNLGSGKKWFLTGSDESLPGNEGVRAQPELRVCPTING